MHRLLILNGSIGGQSGNTAAALNVLAHHLSPRAEVSFAHLNEISNLDPLIEMIQRADGFVFATGTYWDSWGSPLQEFFEDATSFESSDLWIGKPAAALVTMHSVGGKEVLSRLQGVLSSLGLFIPPMSGLVYSLANQQALGSKNEDSMADDFWRLNDLEIIANNLLTALDHRKQMAWRTWPVDESDPRRLWIKA